MIAVDGVHDCLIIGLPFLAAHESLAGVLAQFLNLGEVIRHGADNVPLPVSDVVDDGITNVGLVCHLLYVERKHLRELVVGEILTIFAVFGQNVGPV